MDVGFVNSTNHPHAAMMVLNNKTPALLVVFDCWCVKIFLGRWQIFMIRQWHDQHAINIFITSLINNAHSSWTNKKINLKGGIIYWFKHWTRRETQTKNIYSNQLLYTHWLVRMTIRTFSTSETQTSDTQINMIFYIHPIHHIARWFLVVIDDFMTHPCIFKRKATATYY